jgi:phosphate transport system protein
MPAHFIRELDTVKKMILSLAAMVEDNLRLAMKSVVERDAKLALQVIETDHDIDREEVRVEEECLKVLALYQPVANDLRFIVAILKINHDIERIGDLAVNIGERALTLSQHVPLPRDFNLHRLADRAQMMVSRSLDALINRDAKLAREIWLSDDDVDRSNREILTAVEEEIKKRPDLLPAFLALTSVSRTLERVADHATNIAKDVIYMIEGDIVRHRSRQYREKMQESAGSGG